MQIRTQLALLACLLLAACGSKDPRELISAGEKQLINRDYEDAVSSFETALDQLEDDEHALRMAALLGRCKALAALDGTFASRAFLSLADSEPLEFDDYREFAEALRDAGAYEEAAAILEHAQLQFPGEAQINRLVQQIGKLAEIASAGEDNSAMEAFSGLGYVSSGAPEEDAEKEE